MSDGLLEPFSDYAESFRQAFGQDSFASSDQAFAFVLLALERFELEDTSFYPYSSKYDRYLDGKADQPPQEQRGLACSTTASANPATSPTSTTTMPRS